MAEFDIEKFPTSPTAKRMLSRVSPVYTSSYIAKWLYEVMGRELDEARTLFIELIKQRFPDTATWGIAYLEHKYSITPDDSLTLLERRARLQRRQRKRHPLSPWQFERIISDCFGFRVDVDETVEHGVLHIRTEVNANIGDPKPLYQEIVRIKPAHLVVCVDSAAQAVDNLYYASAPTIHTTYEIRPAEITDATAEARRYIGAAVSTHTAYEVYPDIARDAATDARRYIGAAVFTHTAYEVYPDIVQDAVADSRLYAGGVGSIYKSIEVTQT